MPREPAILLILALLLLVTAGAIAYSIYKFCKEFLMSNSNLDRELDFGKRIAEFKQVLQSNEEMAIAIVEVLNSGNDSAIAEAKKLAEGIASNSQNARG